MSKKLTDNRYEQEGQLKISKTLFSSVAQFPRQLTCEVKHFSAPLGFNFLNYNMEIAIINFSIFFS